jgi:sugar/nucleoside kinase (ribokinase family)
MFDVCIIGHVTRDIIRLRRRASNEMSGGVSYYAGMALQSLGLETAVISKAAKKDANEIMAKLQRIGVSTYCSATTATTVFENDYSGDGLEIRDQRVRSVASAFDPRDLGRLRAKIFHLGPLTDGDMSVGFLKAVSRQRGRVFLDVQGFLRKIDHGQVHLVDWRDKREGLVHVDILKANLPEARILSGEDDPEGAARAIADLGPAEVVVTLGGEGSLLLASGRVYRVPAFRPRTIVDPTGCGDSYSAGYIFYRLQSGDAEAAGRFGAAVATLKLQRYGPFVGSTREVRALLREAETV